LHTQAAGKNLFFAFFVLCPEKISPRPPTKIVLIKDRINHNVAESVRKN